MHTEPDFENLLAERKASAQESLEAVTPENLHKLMDELFADNPNHP